MLTQANEIRKIIRDTWPAVQFIWMQDRFYIKPSITEIEGFLIDSGIPKLKFNGELMDCDDYALLVNAYVKRRRIDISDNLPPGEDYHLAFGEAFGDNIRGGETPHSLNICVAQEGLFLIDPQVYEYWQPTTNDSVLLVKM